MDERKGELTVLSPLSADPREVCIREALRLCSKNNLRCFITVGTPHGNIDSYWKSASNFLSKGLIENLRDSADLMEEDLNHG